jgi:predicted nucleic acid-binding protein
MFRFRAVGDGHNGFRKAAKKPRGPRPGGRAASAIGGGRQRPIGAYVLIAGQALVRALTLVTHNTGEFQRVPGLRVEDWE